MRSVLISEVFKDTTLGIIKKHNIDTVVILKGRVPEVLYENGVIVYNTTSIDREGSWTGWELAGSDIEKAGRLNKKFIYDDGMDYSRALVKELWWGSYNTKGKLERYIKHFNENGIIVYVQADQTISSDLKVKKQFKSDDRYYGWGIRIVLKIIRSYFSKLETRRRKSNVQKVHYDVLFHPRGYPFIKNVLSYFEKKNILAGFGVEDTVNEVQYLGNIIKEEIPYVFVQHSLYGILKTLIKIVPILVTEAGKLKRTIGEREAAMIMYHWAKLVLNVRQYKLLFKSVKPSSILTVAKENNGRTDLLIQVARKNGAAVVNTMNGLKQGLPKEKDTQFDAWCVWSRQQKKMLVEKIGTSPSQLYITGHLQSDMANGYSYNGTIDEILARSEGKKRIACFTQPQELSGPYRRKFLETVLCYLETRRDVVIFLKPHGREKNDDLSFYRSLESDRFFLIEDDRKNRKNILYDVIDNVDLTTVIYSTVAMEALFFKKPVISVNYTGIPGVLPLIDNNWVYEASNQNEFNSIADGLLDRKILPMGYPVTVGPVNGEAAYRTYRIIKKLSRT